MQTKRATMWASEGSVTMVNQRHRLWGDAQGRPVGFRRIRIVSVLAVTGAAVVGAGTVIAGSSGALPSASANAEAPRALVSDPESLLDARSPGERRYGWLVNTKQGGFPADDRESPTERVLSAVRHRPTATTIPAGISAVEPLAFPIDGGPGTTSIFSNPLGYDEPVQEAGPSAALGGPALSGAALPGSGGPGRGDGGTTNPGISVSGVPEPSIWVMLILGFAMTGSAMRTRRSVVPARGS